MDSVPPRQNVSAPRTERLFAANSEMNLLIRNGNFAEAQKAVAGIAAKRMTSRSIPQGIVADALGHDARCESAYQVAVNKAMKDSDRATDRPLRDW